MEKGDRLRSAPFTARTEAFLADWLAVRPSQATTVFCSLLPRSYARPLTVNGLKHILKRLKREAGVTGRANPHSFRHGFAREMLRKGASLPEVSQLMGHSNVNTTASFYAVFGGRELSERHERFSPLTDVFSSEEEER